MQITYVEVSGEIGRFSKFCTPGVDPATAAFLTTTAAL
jgi:hypothetical protein